MAEHTPGPWTIDPPHDGNYPIREGPDGYLIATVWKDDSGFQEGDARLIAAAPDLIAACRAFVAWDVDEHPDEFHEGRLESIARMIRAAVEKADGK